MRNFWTYLLALTIVGCTLNDSDPILKENIESRLADSLGVLNFDEQTDFEWDEMIILGPYSRQEKIEKENEIEFTRSMNSPIASFGNYSLVVFLKDKKEVSYVELNRIADFENERTLIIKEKAIFKLEGGTMKLVDN